MVVGWEGYGKSGVEEGDGSGVVAEGGRQTVEKYFFCPEGQSCTEPRREPSTHSESEFSLAALTLKWETLAEMRQVKCLALIKTVGVAAAVAAAWRPMCGTTAALDAADVALVAASTKALLWLAGRDRHRRRLNIGDGGGGGGGGGWGG